MAGFNCVSLMKEVGGTEGQRRKDLLRQEKYILDAVARGGAMPDWNKI